MLSKRLFDQLKQFDPDLCKLLKLSLDRQVSTLSLIPTDNAASPLSQYLKGSALGNDFVGQNSVEHYSRLEKLAAQRACDLFKAEHAIVRVGNPVAASRVVLQALANPGDTILSFNFRKREHCTGSQMRYNFVKFAIDPHTFNIDFDKVLALAVAHKPKLIIYSPVNYPKNIDCSPLRQIANAVGANLWIDLGQNSGLIAAAKIPSPVPYADVVTFAASDALHGPQSGIILSTNNLADLLKKTVIDTGHVSLKKNVLAALAITFREVACPQYLDYADNVLSNAQSLEAGLHKSGIGTFCSPTQNHLVLARLHDSCVGSTIVDKLAQANLLVKAENLITSNDSISYPVLRLSSLDPTTRALSSDDLFNVGFSLGNFLRSSQSTSDIAAVKDVISSLVQDLPLFSDDWLPDAEVTRGYDPDLMINAMIHWSI